MKANRGAGDGTQAIVDRITRSLLEQLDHQTRAALTLLKEAPPEKRDAFLAQLAEVRGRLVRLRTRVLGASAPALVQAHPARGNKG